MIYKLLLTAYRKFVPLKYPVESLRRYNALREKVKIALIKYKYKMPYVLEIVEDVEEYARDWDRIEGRYEYLADILTHTYLDARVTLTEREREIVRECHRRIGDFLRQCQQYRDAKNTPKVDNTQKMPEEVVIYN